MKLFPHDLQMINQLAGVFVWTQNQCLNQRTLPKVHGYSQFRYRRKSFCLDAKSVFAPAYSYGIQASDLGQPTHE